MVLKVGRRQTNDTLFIQPDQWDWLGIKQGECVIVQDDINKHGDRYLAVYVPKKDNKEGQRLVKEFNS